MKKSWRDLLTFSQVADAYTTSHKGETRVGYAIKRVRDQISKHQETLQEKMADIEIDLCEADEKTVILRDAQGNLQFTKDKFKEKNKQQRKLLDEEFEIDPFLIKDIPGDLTPDQLEIFSGLIIPVSTNGDKPEDPT